MVHLIVKTVFFCICLYLCFWLYQNLDIVSVVTGTADTFRYELSSENLQQSIDAFKKAIN